MLVIVCSGIIIFLLYLYVNVLNGNKRKLPAGAREASMEPGLPIIGVMYKLGKPMHHYMMKLGQKHGPIFRFYFGMREVFVLNDYRILKMCLKDDGENFAGRWNGRLVRRVIKDSGILMMDGEVWARQRSFMLKVLRDFGLGTSRMNEIVQLECSELLKVIDSHKEAKVDFSELIPIHTANIISGFIMKRRFDKEDTTFVKLTTFMDKASKSREILEVFHLMFPLWDNSDICCKITMLLSSRLRQFQEVLDFFVKEIRAHTDNLDLNSDGEDFMERFLIEQSKTLKQTGSFQTFTEFTLVRNAFEMLIAGYETTSTTLGWSLLFLAKHLDIQAKMHAEIVDLIGMERVPSMNDKKSLPYTQAVMDDILRLSTVAPLAVFHRTFHDTVVDGIFIPENSFIFPNLYACHRDSSVWEKPFDFYPEHFLENSEKEEIKYRPREELVPFGVGKRQCLGESLARAEFFIFLTSIIQQFKVTFADVVTEEMYQDALLGEDGAVRFSKIKCFIFKKYSIDNL